MLKATSAICVSVAQEPKRRRLKRGIVPSQNIPVTFEDNRASCTEKLTEDQLSYQNVKTSTLTEKTNTNSKT